MPGFLFVEGVLWNVPTVCDRLDIILAYCIRPSFMVYAVEMVLPYSQHSHQASAAVNTKGRRCWGIGKGKLLWLFALAFIQTNNNMHFSRGRVVRDQCRTNAY